MRIETKITLTLMKYPTHIRDAYTKILTLESIHKTRTAKENEEILKRIISIIQEASDEI
ncbi:hypothetical protein [Clostridium thermopalmarium]|uniref:Uncharacterized protein n=1 Tax=Clostridium thermopalmarium DSM 5974 TaxID=1121340 RepID=A0A2T0AN57_9CLOT|nr:hypothetical protein [Clostridium thermopalmarium]PRR70316.1 hypothetical protein CPAL_22680 [Clostridium thermopalmarium DSM 5974]PVZ20852.1 hypothetical protein LX19_02580 [Clostridium thermopalmarium DSM 5974]